MPSTGRSRSIAARVSATSNASRSGTVPTVSGAALLVGAGVDVGAAGEDQAVDQLERLLRVLDQQRVGREHRDEAAGALHGVDVVGAAAAPPAGPRRSSGALERGADADHGTCHPPHHRINSAGIEPRESDEQSQSEHELESVNVRVADGVATIELNRPQALNAWNAQLGADLLAALRARRRGRRGARAADHRRRARLLLGRGSEGHERRRHHAGGAPGRLQDADRALPPDHARDPRGAQAGARGRQRPGGRDRLLAGALLRSDRRGRERVLPARVRQHRPGPRRRLLAVRAHARRLRARERAVDAGRAAAARRRRSSGA